MWTTLSNLKLTTKSLWNWHFQIDHLGNWERSELDWCQLKMKQNWTALRSRHPNLDDWLRRLNSEKRSDLNSSTFEFYKISGWIFFELILSESNFLESTLRTWRDVKVGNYSRYHFSNLRMKSTSSFIKPVWSHHNQTVLILSRGWFWTPSSRA